MKKNIKHVGCDIVHYSKRPKRRHFTPLHAVALVGYSLVALAIPRVEAATKTWNSGSNQLWLTGGNWSASGAPGTTDVALFNGSALPPSGTVAINLKNGANTKLQAITLTAAAGNLTLGNNETGGNSNANNLILTGTTINSVANTVLANLTASASTLTIQDNVLGGSKNMNLSLTSANNVIQASTNNNVVISSIITGASASLAFQGGGTLTLSGMNAFTGALSIVDGTLKIGTINNAGIAGVLGNSSSAVKLGSSGKTGTLQYTGASSTSNKAFTMVEEGGVLDVTNAATSLTLSGDIDGDGGLEKAGAGTLILTGTASHSGGTNVTDGSLIINGTHTSDLAVRDGGYLGGVAEIDGKLFVDTGGIVSPGNSTAIMRTGDFETAFDAHIAIELGGTAAGYNTDGTDGYDQIAADGAITLAAGTVIDVTLLNSYDPAMNTIYNILTATGGFGSTDLTTLLINGPILFNGHSFAARFADLGGGVTALQLEVIPEPETWAMFAGGFGMLICWSAARRRGYFRI